jgi:signal transduction histidine kinase/CheY-like chemotaxis protein/HAMP domain-containing protein
MKRFSFGSLRVRLILLVLVAIIPSLVIILLTGREARTISGQNAKHEAMQLAVVASGNQDLLIESTHQLLAGLARLPELRKEDPGTCSALFADLLKRYRQYNNIVTVKPNGDLWCSGIPASGPTNYADRGWFPEVMRTRDLVIGEYVIGRISRKPQSSIAYPVIDADGKVKRIVATGFGLEWLNQFVAKTKLSPGSVLTVIDRNGTVLARTLEPDKWVGRTVKEAPIVNAILSRKNQGTLETTGIDGIKRLYAFSPLGTQTSGSVYVFVGIPTSVAYAQADRMVTRNLITLGLAALLAFIVAWVGGNLFLLRRINVLLHTAKRLEDGDLSARTGITVGIGELSKLAYAFDRMAESLEQRIEERRRAEEEKHRNQERAERLAEEMAIIAEIGRVVGSTLDINQVYERVTTETRKLIPSDRLLVNLKKTPEGQFIAAYVSGIDNPGRRVGDLYPSQGSATGVVMHTRTGILIQPTDPEEIKDLYPNLYETFKTGLRSTMSVPLISMDEVIGSMNFRSKTLKAYTEQDLRLAEKIGMQVAGAIANAQLYKDLKETEKSLRESEERLHRSEKMEALGQLAGGVAHDLNNVLGVLTGYSELLLGEIPEGQRSRDHVEKILQSTEKGAAIIQDLLTLARRGVMVSEVVNLNRVVSDFLKTPVFEKIKDYHPQVIFRTEYDKNLLNIKGSPVHLEKTLMNLVSNAAEAISGTGEVTIRTENCYLDKAVRGYDEIKEGDYTVLTVSDTGMGIPAENREKIFEPFYTKKTMGRSGTGLGLAIVWGTVKDHHGYIDVRTEVGEGTTFTLYFPVTREEMTASQQKVPPERYMGNGESVLVVDDIAEQRDIASKLLTRLGYEVHLASSGEEAVEYLKRNKADILVLDMIMAPGIDGLETYQRVREINPIQKAIIVSGFSETERVKEAQKLGVGAYVKKPYVMERIGVAIRDELNR